MEISLSVVLFHVKTHEPNSMQQSVTIRICSSACIGNTSPGKYWNIFDSAFKLKSRHFVLFVSLVFNVPPDYSTIT